MKLVILGSGYMAKAIAAGLVRQKAVDAKDIVMINPVDACSAKVFAEQTGIAFGGKEEVAAADVIITAFKPQNLSEAAAMYQPYFHKGQLLLSIMAGVELATIEKLLPAGMAVIRTMPNLALSVGKSATAYALGKYASLQDGMLCEKLFGALGEVKRVKEEDISVVTALSGSGPAYFYLLAEAMVKSAAALGMERETAVSLCKATFLGTALLWEQENADAEEMKKRITSKKGTTEAALKAMEENGFYKAIEAGLKAANERSNELAAETRQ